MSVSAVKRLSSSLHPAGLAYVSAASVTGSVAQWWLSQSTLKCDTNKSGG